jgi:F1F0 ATPase subunit 2
MNNLLLLVLMFVTGVLLAIIYLGALWLTLKNLHKRRYAALWLISSLLIRMLLLVFSFYLILGDGHWERLLAALSGFITMRLLATSNVRRQLMQGRGHGETPV